MKPLLALALLLALFFSVTLGLRPYGTPSEARYIEVPRQMVATGDWLTPRLNGVKYFEKPPLFYWLQAAQLQRFGMGEFSGRFWTMALMLALCLATYGAGSALYGRRSGVFAGVALATSVLGFSLSRIVLLDVPVSLFLTGTLFSFLFAVRAPAGKTRDGWLLLMYGAAALAVLTKGLIGVVLPGLVIGSWIALTNRWALLAQVRLLPGLLFFLLITVPWHLLAGQVTPEFLHFYFIHEHFERYLTKEHHRYQPWWFFAVVLVAGWLPWVFFLPQALREGLRGAWRERVGDGSKLFLLLWVGLLFVFFSVSDSKLIPYILPIFPPLALLLGRYGAARWETDNDYMAALIPPPIGGRLGGERNRHSPSRTYPLPNPPPEGEGINYAGDQGFRIGVLMQAVLLALLLATSPFLWPLLSAKGLLTPPLRPFVLLLLAELALTLIVLLLWHRSSARALLAVLAGYAVILSLTLDVAAAHYPRDSIKSFIPYLQQELRMHPQEEIAVFRHYYQDLPVYLNRNVTVAGIQDEMAFGIGIEPATRGWMIDEPEFWRRWNRPGHAMAMILRKNVLQSLTPPAGSTLQPVMETDNDVMVINRGLDD